MPSTPVNPWFIYFRERCPFGSYVLLSAGLGLAPQVLSGASVSVTRVIWSSLLMFSFFVVLRMMDEVKDYKKDQIAHPERPLPRGLVSYAAAQKAVTYGLVLMGGLTVGTWVLWGFTPGFLFGLTTAYLYLMYREFYCGPFLEKFPLVYALTHQAILFLLCGTAAACAMIPDSPLTLTNWNPPGAGLFLAGIQIFPAFFAYEIGRKMNPAAHRVLGYYRQIYGLLGCRLVLTLLLGLGAVGLFWGSTAASFISEKGLYVWVGLGSVGLFQSLIVVWMAGDRYYKGVAHATTLNLILAIYAPVVAFYGF